MKSAGLNGYEYVFFKATYDIIGGDIKKIVLNFFRNEKLLKKLNATNVALIHRVECSYHIANRGPFLIAISYKNTYVK